MMTCLDLDKSPLILPLIPPTRSAVWTDPSLSPQETPTYSGPIPPTPKPASTKESTLHIQWLETKATSIMSELGKKMLP